VNYELVKIDNVGDEEHLIRNVTNGSLLANNQIVKERCSLSFFNKQSAII